MAFGLTFGNVERIAERREQFRALDRRGLKGIVEHPTPPRIVTPGRLTKSFETPVEATRSGAGPVYSH